MALNVFSQYLRLIKWRQSGAVGECDTSSVRKICEQLIREAARE